MALSLSEGFRSFKKGLDKKLVWAYWLAVKEEAWAILWGAGVIGVPITIITLYLSPSWKALGWTAAWCFFMAGYYVWRADHVRLEKKIEPTYVRRHYWGREQGEGVQYYFGIINKGEAATIRDVRVQLQELAPEIESINWLPIGLHQQHDNLVTDTATFAKTFDLHPNEVKNIDLLTGINGQKYFNVSHIVPGVNAVVQITGRHRLKVIIAGTDVPVSFAWFTVWMEDDGMLRCELDPATT
jgi:hypothetical protein